MTEDNFIKMLAEVHGSTPYLADAELVKSEHGFDLYSVDSFSETEDFFTFTPPEIIGHNMAIAVCSDILACGVSPEILLQSWCIDQSKSSTYYKQIATGVEQVLNFYHAKCIGGDIGTSQPWSWTATVKGASKTPVTRVAKQRIPFDLYISGKMGLANLAAFTNSPLPQCQLRNPVPPESLFATDSSGGFFDALENFRRVNSGLTVKIDLTKVVHDELTNAPFNPLYALIGGVGEYELVYALPQEVKTEGIKIGEGYFVENSANDFQLFQGEERVGKITSSPPDYRTISPENWLKETANYLFEVMNYE